MFVKEELMKLTNVTLSTMCKERGIPVYNGKNHINKTEMVNRLMYFEAGHDSVQTEEKPQEESKPIIHKAQPKPVVKASEKARTVNNPVVSPALRKQLNDTIKENEEKEYQSTPWVMGGKDEFIEKAEVGTLMAFLDSNGKPRTAKMVNRSSSRRVVKLVTEFEWEFIVPYDNVLWVKRGERWHKAIYNMLKEYQNGKPVNVVYKSREEDQ